MQLSIADITIPENRKRGVRDVSSLAKSMDAIGLLNPVVVTKTNRLVAGLRRITAAKELKWTKIEARQIDLSDIVSQIAEIDENLEREDLTVLERSEQLAERKALYEALHPETRNGYGPGRGKKDRNNSVPFTADTAAKTKQSRSTIEQEVKIATSLPEEVKEKIRGTTVEDRKADLLKLSRMDEKEQKQVAEKIAAGATSIKEAKKEIHREAKTPSKTQAKKAAENWKLFHAECKTLDIEAGSVDCIITDPPYPKEFLPCYSDLGEAAARILKPGGSCIVMVGQSYLPDVIARLGEHLTYHWMVAYLTPGGQAVQLWDRKVNTFWKPLLWFVKPPFDSKEWQGDVVGSKTNDNDKRFHDWGQSESGMAAIIDRFTFPGQTILDPFVGGGTTGVVALKLGRNFIGSDADAKQIEISRSRLMECQ